MISGFNTDVAYNGVVYHVQTEDKGLETPLILSLIYTGGQILASKRTPYNDLVADGLDEKVLAERLSRQHKLLCAAIKAGRIEDIKRMGQREVEKQQAARSVPVAPPPAPEPPAKPPPPKPKSVHLPELLGLRKSLSGTLPPVPERHVSYSSGPAALDLVEAAFTDSLQVRLIGNDNFVAGTPIDLKILVERRVEGVFFQLAEIPVMVKIMGSSFRPLTYYGETDADGYAYLRLQLPDFTTGRAALLVRVVDDSGEAEVRRIIQRRMA